MGPYGRDDQPTGLFSQYEEGFAALMKKAGGINGEINRNDRQNVQRVLELGRTLARAKDMCKDGEWMPAYKAQSISSQRVSEALRAAAAPQTDQMKWESIQDLKAWLATKDAPANVTIPTGGGNCTAGLSGNAPQQCCRECRTRNNNTPRPGCKDCKELNAPVKAAKLCPKCQESGYVIGCEACKVLNGGKRTAQPEQPRAEEKPQEREPGSDDGTVDEEFERRYGYDLKLIDQAVKPLWTQYRKVAKVYGLRCGDRVDEVDPLLQPAVRAFGEAKDKLRRAVRAARQRMMETWQKEEEIKE